MLINLWEKEVTGGRSGHVGWKVCQFDSFSSREVVSLAWAERLDCGRSDQGVRTVRRSLNKFDQRRVGSLMGFKNEGRTVRPWGADGPLIS